ncbi:toxic anion resistance protein [Tepidibacillus marianensis]|uniref:toxic anion resistance protein n=1 Tax=Tepidibacillus marianensis TaxID=3131995 RepID=UPI00386CB1CD
MVKKEMDLIEETMRNNEITLSNDPKVLHLVDQLDEKNQTDLLEFGKAPATEISRFADRILGTMKSGHAEDSNQLIKHLNKVMDKFDRNDFEEPKGIFSKWLNRGQKAIENMFQKYQSMGKEIDKVYIEISIYQDELVKNTNILNDLYKENYNYYLEIEKYIVAGKIKIEEIKREVLPSYEKLAEDGDQQAIMELETINTGLELLEQRIYDLEMAKMVAFQTAPQIRLIQRGNAKLIAKINVAFVITIPVFKNGLIQAVSAKRQKLVADSLSELDKRTNEMLVQNAKNIAQQSKEIAHLSGRPSIKIEAIEESWNIIMNGLEETKTIEEENKRLRIEGAHRINELIENFKNQQQLQ